MSLKSAIHAMAARLFGPAKSEPDRPVVQYVNSKRAYYRLQREATTDQLRREVAAMKGKIVK
jgi:hypothetical protein